MTVEMVTLGVIGVWLQALPWFIVQFYVLGIIAFIFMHLPLDNSH